MNKLDLNIGDMLTSLDYWVKYDVGTQNHVFNKGNKYELIYYNKYYNSYTIKSEIYKYANENKIKLEKSVFESLDDLEKYFFLFEDAYYNKNINSIHKINSLKTKHHFGRSLKLIEKSENPVVHAYIREIFRLIQIGTSPIMGLILEKKE